MKILFVVEHFHPYVGGAEELFLNLSRSLSQKGYDIIVVTTLHDKKLLKNEVFEGVKIIRVNCLNRFLFTLLSLPSIFKNLKGVDFIHTTSYNSAIPAFIAGLFGRKKVIITFHEVWDKLWFKLPFTPKWKLLGYYLYENLILKLPFYKYIAVSESTKEALIQKGINVSKIEKLYNGLDYEVFKNYKFIPPENFVYCFFGRLGISKGIDLLIEASSDFLNKSPQAKLKLIIPTYPDNLFEKVLKMIRYYNLESKVILLNNLSKNDLFKEVSSSSCVIIPSHSEGFCYVAVESVALNVPVISSGKGSLKEVVSGKHIVLQELDVSNIVIGLEKAMKNEWIYKSPHSFILSESVMGYVDLYNNLKNTR